jgi:hypothetical protein
MTQPTDTLSTETTETTKTTLEDTNPRGNESLLDASLPPTPEISTGRRDIEEPIPSEAALSNDSTPRNIQEREKVVAAKERLVAKREKLQTEREITFNTKVTQAVEISAARDLVPDPEPTFEQDPDPLQNGQRVQLAHGHSNVGIVDRVIPDPKATLYQVKWGSGHVREGSYRRKDLVKEGERCLTEVVREIDPGWEPKKDEVVQLLHGPIREGRIQGTSRNGLDVQYDVIWFGGFPEKGSYPKMHLVPNGTRRLVSKPAS